MKTRQILIVDDDAGIREVIKITLSTMTSWEVLMAASGKEALAIAVQEHPDAILLDMTMPEMDGIETLKLIRANPATGAIPVILVTAKIPSQEPQEFDNLSIAGTIAKPFNILELVQKIQKILHWDEDGD